MIERVERHGGDVKTRLRLAGALTFSSELLPIDLAVRDWSRRDHVVAERLRRVDNRRMDYLRLLFGALYPDEVEARSILAFSLVIGHHFLAAATMPGPLPAFANNQPVTSIVNTIRDLAPRRGPAAARRPRRIGPIGDLASCLGRCGQMADSIRLATK